MMEIGKVFLGKMHRSFFSHEPELLEEKTLIACEENVQVETCKI